MARISINAQRYLDHSVTLYTNTIKRTHDFTLSENPLGCSSKVSKYFKENEFNFSGYPKSKGIELRSILAEEFNLEGNNIYVGPGSEALLYQTAHLFIDNETTTVIPRITYPVIAKSIAKQGGKIIYSDMSPEMEIQIDDFVKKAKTENASIVYICNPNNPTGNVLKKKEIISLITKLPDTTVVVDEAGIEFCEESESVIDQVKNFSNLIVIKTFSKAYGLAALRVAYLVSSADTVEMFEKLGEPFPINCIGEKLSAIALLDTEFITKTQQFITQERIKMSNSLTSAGFKVFPSLCNNLFIKVPEGSKKHIMQVLAENDISVIDGECYDSTTKDCLRIAIRNSKTNEYLNNILGNINQEIINLSKISSTESLATKGI